MAKTGIALSQEENEALFSLMDTDGSGNLDIWELVMAISPPDYPGGSANYHWRKRTNEMEQEYLERCAEGPGAGLRAFVEEQKQQHLTSWGWSLEEMVERLRVKLDQKSSRGGKIYRMFDRKRGGGGIDQEDFQIVCAELGFVLSEEDVARFYSVHDRDGDGKLSMAEFADALTPAQGVPPRSLCRDVLPVETEMPTIVNAKAEERREFAPQRLCGCGQGNEMKPLNPPYPSMPRENIIYPHTTAAGHGHVSHQPSPPPKSAASSRPHTARNRVPDPVETPTHRWEVPAEQRAPRTSRPSTTRSDAPRGERRNQPMAVAAKKTTTKAMQQPASVSTGSPMKVAAAAQRRPLTARQARPPVQDKDVQALRQSKANRTRREPQPPMMSMSPIQQQRRDPLAERDFSGPALSLMTKTKVDKAKARRPTSAVVGRSAQTGFAGIPFDSMPTTRWLTEEQCQTARLASETKKNEAEAHQRKVGQTLDLTQRAPQPPPAAPTPPPQGRSRTQQAAVLAEQNRRRPMTARTAKNMSPSSLAETIASLGSWVGPV